MPIYKVNVTTTIQEWRDDGNYVPPSHLNYNTLFFIEGETFTDIAPQIDRLIAAMKGVKNG